MSARIWKSLGIKPTRDQAAITNAFQKQKTLLGENLEQIQFLEEDYQQALRLAAELDQAADQPGTRKNRLVGQQTSAEKKTGSNTGCFVVLGLMIFLGVTGYYNGMIADLFYTENADQPEAVVEPIPESPLNNAVLDCDSERVKRALVMGEDPNFPYLGVSVFLVAASSCNGEIILLLNDYGVDTSITDEDGNTGLHFAVLGNSAEVVRTLLDMKANPALTNKEGQTPLALAQYLGYEELVTILSQANRQ